MPATIRDIKNRTGLSLATISKYLNGGNVLPENKALIEEAIKELHYEVNEIARGLVKNKTRTVGVIIYDIASFFSSNLLHYLGQELRENGYAMVICDSCNNEKQEKENVKFLLSRKVDGIIVVPVNTSGKFLDPAKKANIPVVLLDRAFQDEAYDCVRIDNRVTAFRAVDILIKHNHKKIAFIGSDVEDTGIERYKGYREALEQADIPLQKNYIKLGKFGLENGYQYMKELMCQEDRPTAVFLSNYETALGGVMALNELNISFPEEVSVFGFDDLLVSNIVKPSLWLVEQPMETLCKNAVRLLLERISNGNEGEAMKLSFGAKIREGKSIRKI